MLTRKWNLLTHPFTTHLFDGGILPCTFWLAAARMRRRVIGDIMMNVKFEEGGFETISEVTHRHKTHSRLVPVTCGIYYHVIIADLCSPNSFNHCWDPALAATGKRNKPAKRENCAEIFSFSLFLFLLQKTRALTLSTNLRWIIWWFEVK